MPLHKIRDFDPDYRNHFEGQDVIGHDLYAGFPYRIRQILTAFVLVLVVASTTACSNVAARSPQATTTLDLGTEYSQTYGQLARGDSASGQAFGDWVVKVSKGLVTDAYVRDNNKLGAVISSQVRPNEVKPLTQSLVQGFHKNFPNQDLTVLMYAPDKELILTARYDSQSNRIQYQSAS